MRNIQKNDSNTLWFCVASGALFFACSDDRAQINAPPGGQGTSTSSSGSMNTGGAGGEAGNNMQGGAGGMGTGGTGGINTMPECGNSIIELGEVCDGLALGGLVCKDFGFDNGTLACTAQCTFNTSGCSGTESCADGSDNDGDGDIDCMDSDCTGPCMNSCNSIVSLSDPATVNGDISGHASQQDPSCLSPAGSGSEVVYVFTAAQSGMLDLKLVSLFDLGISVRTTCTSAASEQGCADQNSPDGSVRLAIPINQGQSVFVHIDGYSPLDAGPYTLYAKSRPIACGDGISDPSEECDDGNSASGDGCSAACKVEASETETNNTAGTANIYVNPFFGFISPAGDVDYISFSVVQGPAAVVANTFDFGDGACAAGLLDTKIEILASNGSTVLASDDNGGEQLCAKAVATGLFPGTYFAKVSAPNAGDTFAYVLSISQELCGNAMVGSGEQCDDGNTNAGDGCGPNCQFELTESEPNNTSMQADSFANPWVAAINPANDIDIISIAVPGPASFLGAQTIDHGTGACTAGNIDNIIEILGTDGSTILATDDDNGEGYCAYAAADNLPAGTYYVRVKAGPLNINTPFSYGIDMIIQ